jgi:hypothetical protein
MTVKPAALLRLEEIGHGRGAAASVTAHVDRPFLPDRDIPSLPSTAAVAPVPARGYVITTHLDEAPVQVI